jgi:hypothetical protein
MTQKTHSYSPDAGAENAQAVTAVEDKKPTESVLQSRTFGERAHSAIFEFGLNFALNLAVSAGFTYWVKHSTRPFGFKNAFKPEGAAHGRFYSSNSPMAFYESVVDGIAKTPLLKTIQDDTKRLQRSKTMADVLLLTTGGHAVMIPSVWLGEKFKTPIVEGLDNLYYGKETVANDEGIQARHHAIETAEKPTFANSVLSRMGTVFATQTTAFVIGNKSNFITNAFKSTKVPVLSQFHGLEEIAENVGRVSGNALEFIMPVKAKGLNAKLRTKGYSFSHEQVEGLFPEKHFDGFTRADRISAFESLRTNTSPIPGNPHYESAFPDFGKYLALDTIYTAVTALTIYPFIKAFKAMLPGMSYTQEPKEKPSASVAFVQPEGRVEQASHALKAGGR